MDSNREQIASRAVAPVLSRLRYDGKEFDDKVDWMEVAKNSVANPQVADVAK